ncbi:MAG: hypothetical protein SPJ13_02280 [Bacteroidales bacterium]|nr:hypothetical protein [Bacteroidales bacterium]
MAAHISCLSPTAVGDKQEMCAATVPAYTCLCLRCFLPTAFDATHSCRLDQKRDMSSNGVNEDVTRCRLAHARPTLSGNASAFHHLCPQLL